MTLAAGTRLGPYEILSALGVGGMGEVYKAKDTRLDRTVAIKVLPAQLAGDPQFRERFDREARAISALDHPHICALYDVGEIPSPVLPATGHEPPATIRFLVMQYLEGETLQDRLAKGALPLDQALKTAIEIASALDKAHRAGITHRDLKPGNIMLTKAGAKLLDFGLAKAASPAEAGHYVRGVGAGLQTGPHGLSMLPTTPPNLTAQGTILGTFQYMAPEQLEGVEADARTDLFAFGAVVYEMLTGKKAFEGKSQASLIGAIMHAEPQPIATSQPLTPPALDHIVKRCLAKDPDERWQSASDLMRELKWIADLAGSVASSPSQPSTPPRLSRPWSTFGAGAAVLVIGASLAAAVTWTLMRSTPPTSHAVRFTIIPPAPQSLASFTSLNTGALLAISPDGTHLAYLAGVGGQTQLMLRALDRIDAEPVRGATDARSPFFSPDGKWIGFFQGTAELKKVSTTGGPAITICRVTGNARGASWSPDDTIVFSTSNQDTGLFSVPAGGGEPKVLTKPDRKQGELNHSFPSVLPGGRAVLFTITYGAQAGSVAALDLTSGQTKILIRGGSNAQYAHSGHLVYEAAGALRAVRFDPARLEVIGDPVPVIDKIATASVAGVAEFSVSETGALVYIPSDAADDRSLVWVDRQGREETLKAPKRAYFALRLSPDGTKVAIDSRDQQRDIWLWDFARETLSPFTIDPGSDTFPIWTPDGRYIVFSSSRTGTFANLFRQAADGTGTAERLTTAAFSQFPTSFSPDGSRLVLIEQVLKTGSDVSMLSMDGKTVPLVQTPATDVNGEISPDGHWLAYQSNESGQAQIYVRPFPNVNAGRWQVSTTGGVMPAWAPNGRELFYLDGGRFLTAVPVQTVGRFSWGNSTRLFEQQYFSGVTNSRPYDVSRDGQRFLMIKESPAVEKAGMVVVLTWDEELKRLAPTTR